MGTDSIGEIDYQRLKDIIQRELEIGLDTGNVSTATSTTVTDLTKNWGVDQWKNAYIEITDGTGKGQIRLISSNTANTITVSTSWTTTPDATSKYRIFGAPAQITQLINILNQLDIKLSELRDALRGTGDKTLTDLESDLSSILSKLDVTLSTRASESTLSDFRDRLKYISKGSIFNTSVTANTNVFASDLSPTNTPCIFRIYVVVSFTTSPVLNVMRTSGGTTVSESLNEGSPLVSDSAYMFDVIVDSGETINIQFDQSGTVKKLSVVEISGG